MFSHSGLNNLSIMAVPVLLPTMNATMQADPLTVTSLEFTTDNKISGFAAGLTVDGFQFSSPLNIKPLHFTANCKKSSGTKLRTFSRMTTCVPEVGTLGLFAGASVLLFSRFRSSLGRSTRQ
jgi:hypothetical protein